MVTPLRISVSTSVGSLSVLTWYPSLSSSAACSRRWPRSSSTYEIFDGGKLDGHVILLC